MIKATPEKIADFTNAIQKMQSGYVVIAEIDGVKIPVTRLYFGADTTNGPLHDFDRLRVFDSVEEAKEFLRPTPTEQFVAAAFVDTGKLTDTGAPHDE